MKQEWEAYWDNYRFPDHFMQNEGEPFNNPIRVLIAQESIGSVLDVGCASCISYPLFKDYVGMDFTLQFLKSGKKKYPDVPAVLGYNFQLPFRSDAFGTAFIKDVLEHMSPEAYRAVIAEMWRVSKFQIILAFYGHLNKPKVEQLREPDEHNAGVPPYKGGIYYFNAYGKQDIIDAVTKLPRFDGYQIIEGIQRENCDDKGRVMVIVRKQK